MTQTIQAHFDGKTIVPDEPVHFTEGQKLVVQIEIADETKPRHAKLREFAADLEGAPQDLAEQHDHYLYGTPKR